MGWNPVANEVAEVYIEAQRRGESGPEVDAEARKVLDRHGPLTAGQLRDIKASLRHDYARSLPGARRYVQVQHLIRQVDTLLGG